MKSLVFQWDHDGILGNLLVYWFKCAFVSLIITSSQIKKVTVSFSLPLPGTLQ